MKLFLDDLRPAPQGEDWVCVRNFKDCIFALGTKDFSYVSLDYSLGEQFTGFHVLEWMVRNNRFPERLNIHSTFSYGVSQMRSYIKAHFPATCCVTFSAAVS